jgi:hypothetical protein
MRNLAGQRYVSVKGFQDITSQRAFGILLQEFSFQSTAARSFVEFDIDFPDIIIL